MKLTSPKPKKCKVCLELYVPRSRLMRVCSIVCAIELVNQHKVKKAAQSAHSVLKAGRIAQKTLTQWLNEAQSAFNAWIRYRDKDKPCISSGRPLTGKFDAGHLRTVKSAPQCRFDEDNVHGQTVHDNRDLSGNVLEFRRRLIERIGLERVEAVLNNHGSGRYTIPEAKEIIMEYKARLKAITY